MKKIGFIDYYLDEWHANNYPSYIKQQSNGRYEVAIAYGKIDSPIGGKTNEEWSKEQGIPLAETIEEVIEKSDVLIVLSPDNPEMHKELCKLPLASGKLVYVDKTFAPDKKTAIEIFEHADKHNTKCYSSSALRFSSELKEIDKDKIHKIFAEASGPYGDYSVHLIEPVVAVMQTRAKRVMGLGDAAHPSMIVEFEDGRLVQMCLRKGARSKLCIVDKDNKSKEYVLASDYFTCFINSMIEFFDTGIVQVPHEETVDIMAIREAGMVALEKPFKWVEV